VTWKPELKLHQCGLPTRWRSAVSSRSSNFAPRKLKGSCLPSREASQKLVEKERPEFWDILDEVIREHPVMLETRGAPYVAPFLGIQAFEPVLIEGKADPSFTRWLFGLFNADV